MAAATSARELGLPRSTTYHLLDSWSRDGFVVHLAEERRYALGVSAYELGTGYARQEPLQRLARVPLARLVDQTGHSAHLAVLHGSEMLYVIEERAAGRAPLVTDVGVRLPAHLTASGRAHARALPERRTSGRCSRRRRRSCCAPRPRPPLADARCARGCRRCGGAATRPRTAR